MKQLFIVLVSFTGLCFQENSRAQPVLPASQVTVHYDNAGRLVQINIHPEHLQPPGQPPFYPPLDVFMTTNPAAAASGLDGTNWIWIRRTAWGETNLVLTNAWHLKPYFSVGTLLDSDNDLLTDAYEIIVSHTNPTKWDSTGSGVSDGDKLSPNKIPWHIEQARVSTAAIYANSPTATQGGACAQCTVYLPTPAPAGGTTVQYYLGGSAVLNSDYTVSPTAGQLTIPAGNSSGTISLCASSGSTYSPIKLYADITLTNATSCPVDGIPAEVSIVDTGSPGIHVYAFPPWVRSPSATYGTNEAGFYFVRGRSGNDALRASISVTGTAIPGVDYAALPRSIYFPAGIRTNWLPLKILSHDAIADKTVKLTIANASGFQADATDGSAIITIALSGRPPLPVVQVATTVHHATLSKHGWFVFVRSGITNEALRVFYQVTGDTVVGYKDGQHIISYEYLPGYVDIAAGKKMAAVPVIPVHPPSTGEIVTVTVSEGDYLIGTHKTAAVKIDKP